MPANLRLEGVGSGGFAERRPHTTEHARRGVGGSRRGLTVASDTVSIGTMEVIDNALIVAVPGALAAGLDDVLVGGPRGQPSDRVRDHRPGEPPADRPRPRAAVMHEFHAH